ncbi:NHL repeat-containing protein 2 isoform X2 [Drosophila teissieri]|uniref:NHL repeat-containing protein 2 isoform X1 n=1 Tax=Drosophila teissieri TaxID=7243 RepID=UPI001CBA5927|nr:NHL repeat-containing protein 2 isoform X1 [Drosophila teissieri]XP_043663186.1 NHL repeat-containing protein 2 isoform X2 [Drosophila teissieri]
MDCNDDLAAIDILTFITDELLQTYKSSNGENEKARTITRFLDRWNDDISIAKLKGLALEFETDLDWFNVSCPLSVAGLQGKIIVLDFFTYCCINCMHVLPELHSLEERFPIESGIVVIGVHSPKFENERNAANLLSAVQRYGISHPIVNDSRSGMWRAIGIRCWPSLLILSPTGVPMMLLMGEGHGKFLQEFVAASLSFFSRQGKIDHRGLPIKLFSDFQPASNLRFPSKIVRSPNGRYAIADTGNNRVLVLTGGGMIQHKIGGYQPGFVDGNLTTARFNKPQGIAFLNENILIVADTKNHAIRQISLTNGMVETLAGTGHQGNERIGGRLGPLQPLSSPWDVAIFRTRDMDMSFHLDERNILEKTIMLISMAGTHQIWGYFPEGIIWWKFRKFEPLCCVSLIGNGLEENRNNSYPQNAAFAQPSGLAISGDVLYIADSESSSIRKASMIDGKVMPVVGGDRNPLNLFAFGDIDGRLFNAKLQHPLGVTFNDANNRLYVADTYNHKIKVIDIESNDISTLQIKNQDNTNLVLNEPAGLCLDANGRNLLVADTNNHSIHIIDLVTLIAQPFCLDFSLIASASETDAPQDAQKTKENNIIRTLPLDLIKPSNIFFNLRLSPRLNFTEKAPQKWILKSVCQSVKVHPSCGTLLDGTCDLQVQVTKPDFFCESSQIFTIEFVLNLCLSNCCLVKKITVSIKRNDITEQCISNHNVIIDIEQ